ncbi:MAG: hypothetical protein PVG07_13315 [Acidobacteriota bacterium]|jgi:hypothetical protein
MSFDGSEEHPNDHPIRESVLAYLHEDRHAADRRVLEDAVPHLRAALDVLEPAVGPE